MTAFLRQALLLTFSIGLGISLLSCATAKLPNCCGSKAAALPIAAPVKRDECPLVLEIYFDYDRSILKPEALTMLETYWACLSKQLEGRDDWTLDIGGYTDEWGSRDYNIALGERRSKSVIEWFLAKHVPPTKLQPITYGESVPAALEHGHKSWEKNRRSTVTVRFK